MESLEEQFLEAIELLRTAKNHVSRDISIGGQQCSTKITEFLARARGNFLLLQAKELDEKNSEQS